MIPDSQSPIADSFSDRTPDVRLCEPEPASPEFASREAASDGSSCLYPSYPPLEALPLSPQSEIANRQSPIPEPLSPEPSSTAHVGTDFGAHETAAPAIHSAPQPADAPRIGTGLTEPESIGCGAPFDSTIQRFNDSTIPEIAHRQSPIEQLTESQRAEAAHKLKWLRIGADLMRSGLSQTKTAPRIGFSGAHLSRSLEALREAGFGIAELPGEHDELSHEQYEELLLALAPGRSPGGPMKYPLNKREALALRGIVLARSTENAIHFALAVEEFANHPACTPEIRALIHAELERAARLRRLPNWPLSIRRAGMPTIHEAAWFRGPKHAIEVEQVDRRGDFWVTQDGRKIKLKPHTIWEADDASDNEPRRSIDPDTGKPVLTRQALWTQDVFSAALLGFTQVARSHDSYRIEDVADHMLNCVSLYGWPDFLRLEMGEIWNGKFFHGFVPTDPGSTHVLTGWPDEEPWGGFAPCCLVKNVWKSKGKGLIEGSFNLQQAMAAHASLDIGRERGEFEEATRALIRAQRTGEIDERFWSMDLSPDVMARIAERFNLRPKTRQMFGRDQVVPVDLLRNAKGTPLLPSDHWRFCPVKRVATVFGGHVQISVENYPRPFRFKINGVDDQLHLDHGYTVLIAFHPGRPHQGCWIFNAELGVRNREGFRRAEKLILAPHAEDAPQIDLSNAGDFTTRRKANAAVRRSFRAIGQAVKRDYAQDSHGRELTVSTNGRARTVEMNGGPSVHADAPAPAPAPQEPRRLVAASISLDDMNEL